MSKRVQFHVVRDDCDWKVKRAGGDRASSVHDSKGEAIESARGLAQKQPLAQIVVHRKDGVIQTEWTYQQDPRKYPG